MPSEARIVLSLDTTAAHCAVALVQGERTLDTCTEPMERGQAERLLPLVEERLVAAGITWPDVDALAVCRGPGNFTGTRICIAAARGLALALNVPAIGISTFEALAAGRSGPVLVTLQDRRAGVAAQLFRDGRPAGPARIVDADRLGSLPRKTLCIGFRASEIAARYGCTAGPEAASVEPTALARVAAARLQRTEPRPAPLYLRSADAVPAPVPAPRILDDA